MAPGIMRPFIQAAGLTISSQSPSHWRALHMAVLGSTNAESCTTIPANLQQELLMVCLRKNFQTASCIEPCDSPLRNKVSNKAL